MAEMRDCIVTKNEELMRGRWISLRKVHYTDPLGKARVWECIERTTRPKGCKIDAVEIIAILKRVLHYDCILLVKQFRPPLAAYSIEFPAGLIDEGETVVDAARRELLEETGFTATIKHWSPGTSSSPGTSNGTSSLVTAEIDGDDPVNQNPKPKPDETEFIEVLSVPLKELLEKLQEYDSHGWVVNGKLYAYAIGAAQATKAHTLEPGEK